MGIEHNKAFELALNGLNADQLEAFVDRHDVSSCTAGCDTDGWTGFEIFSNGFELCEKSGGEPVQYGEVFGKDGYTAYFFVGAETAASAAVSKTVEENP